MQLFFTKIIYYVKLFFKILAIIDDQSKNLSFRLRKKKNKKIKKNYIVERVSRMKNQSFDRKRENERKEEKSSEGSGANATDDRASQCFFQVVRYERNNAIGS